MPIALEPGITFDVWLDSDESKPIESRPRLIAKTQSLRQQRLLYRVIDKVFEDGAILDDVFDSAVQALLDACVGWRQMGDRAFNREEIEDVLSFSEIRELLRKVAASQRMTVEEKKT